MKRKLVVARSKNAQQVPRPKRPTRMEDLSEDNADLDG